MTREPQGAADSAVENDGGRVEQSPGTVRVRFDLAYDGTAFSGWARQPGLRTVQGEIEKALAGLYSNLGALPNLVVAGRTDAGVHARGQVVHLDLTAAQASKIELSRIALSVNGMLGASTDIVVRQTGRADDGFDARFSALWRRYEYRIADTLLARNPLTRHNTAWTTKPLDLIAMQQVSNELLGLHDWATFCRPRPFATTIRTLQQFEWRRDDEGVVSARLQADAFCHSMVRALVGAVVAVGEERMTVAEIVALRDELERTSAFKVMPARGLTLMEVGYPDAAELALRAAQTRARRTREQVAARAEIG
ncbi:tRNA pseudouridine(38-40) synthase TruA [Subtercola sp. YIM 133946]|uniref:tRNA pseudouridine(38-40) synthase TruA n=1 Tax=Subtercola sp. YIM 133946 TaxID=3118909 RepID=UPI002F93B83F